MDEDSVMELYKAAQLQRMSKKSQERLNTLLNFDYEGYHQYECSEIKQILTNAFLIGYNCGMDKQRDKELEKGE